MGWLVVSISQTVLLHTSADIIFIAGLPAFPGFGVGMSLVCIRLVYMIIYNDWQGSARKAQAHIQASNAMRVSMEMTHTV